MLSAGSIDRQSREGRRMRDLHADDVIRAHLRAARHDTVKSAGRIDDEAAVAIGPVVGNDRDRDERAGLAMVLGERVQIDVGERVAVDDEETARPAAGAALCAALRRNRAPAIRMNNGRGRQDRRRRRRVR